MATKDSLGRWGEEYAARYLHHQGFQILRRNWRSDAGEIDLLLRRGDIFVVCEVKTRRSHRHGHPDEAVDGKRLRRLCSAAEIVAAEHPSATVRVDIVSITASQSGIVVQHREAVTA